VGIGCGDAAVGGSGDDAVPVGGETVVPRGGIVQDCAMRLSGVVRIPIAGEYTFSVGSNDGSRLLIDDEVYLL
jgi:hypothetical protein